MAEFRNIGWLPRFAPVCLMAFFSMLFTQIILVAAAHGASISFQKEVEITLSWDSVNLRRTPSPKGEIMRKLPWGELVFVERIVNNWAKIKVYIDDLLIEDDPSQETNSSIDPKFKPYYKGWIYGAFFDPCHQNYEMLKPHVDHRIMKNSMCLELADNDRGDFNQFLIQYLSAFSKSDKIFILKHSATTVYLENEAYYPSTHERKWIGLTNENAETGDTLLDKLKEIYNLQRLEDRKFEEKLSGNCFEIFGIDVKKNNDALSSYYGDYHCNIKYNKIYVRVELKYMKIGQSWEDNMFFLNFQNKWHLIRINRTHHSC